MEGIKQEMRDRWNSDGKAYDAGPAHGVNDEAEIRRWGDMLASYSGKSVLDVGTGTGFVALLAAEKGLSVTGLDWSVTMLEQAKQKAATACLSIDFMLGETETLPFETNRFDLLTARHFIWTLTEPITAFRQWQRVLKPGGIVLADYSPRKGSKHLGHHYSMETERMLPLNKDVGAEEIAALFHRAGFHGVSFECFERDITHDGSTRQTECFMFRCEK